MMSVPRSQRGGEIVEPLVSTQWFVRMDTLARNAKGGSGSWRCRFRARTLHQSIP